MTAPVLTVDLALLRANLAVVSARVAPATHMLVVKDDAYGHGLPVVVRTAWEAGVRWYGSFDVAEGERVRRALRDTDVQGRARVFVWMLGGDEDIARALAADFDLGVGDLDLLESVARVARAHGARARVHLKIDSGLHRNGIRAEEWESAVARAAQLQSTGDLEVVGIWSHIAEASDAEDDISHEVFRWALDKATAAGLPIVHRHLAASAASFARAEFRYDLARVGAFAYGIRPAGGPGDDALGISPIATLAAEVTEVGPDSVTIGIGALDGLPSTLVNSTVLTAAGEVRVRDIAAVATTLEPWEGASVGDEVVVYGGPRSVTDLAERIDTIGEELALRIGAGRNLRVRYRPAP